MEHKVAVRLYDNEKFGKTFGKGKYYDAIFNGTVDFANERIKYLVDPVPYAKWEVTAKSNEELEVVRNVIEVYADMGIDLTDSKANVNVLCSWIKRFDSNMLKPKVHGVVLLDLKSCQLRMGIEDGERNIAFSHVFSMRSCKETDKNSPSFFASNYDAI